MADTTRTIRTRFTGDNSDLKRAARDAESDIDKFGRNSGKSFTSGFGAWLSGEGGRGMFGAGRTGGTLFGSGIAGALSTPVLGPVLLGALLATVAVVAPVVGAALATGMILAFGAGLAAIPIIIAAQTPRVQTAFSGMVENIKPTIAEFGVPFESVLVEIAGMVERTFFAFAPTLQKAFDSLAPVVEGFADQFFTALEEFVPAIQPVTDAFNALLTTLGPKLGPVFADIADSIAGIADTIAANPEAFASLITFFIDAGDKVLEFTGWLADLWSTFTGFIGDVQHGMGLFVIAVGEGFAKAAESLGVFLTAAGTAAEALGLPFADAVKQAGLDVIAFANQTEATLEDMDTEVEFQGNLTDLKQKLVDAKQELRTVPESKKTALLATIADLERKVRQAQFRIDMLHGKTVTVSVRAAWDPSLTRLSPRAIEGRQHGGPVLGGRTYLVGEAGPELLTMPSGTAGVVTPSAQVPNALGAGGPVDLSERSIRGIGEVMAQIVLAGIGGANGAVARTATLYGRA